MSQSWWHHGLFQSYLKRYVIAVWRSAFHTLLQCKEEEEEELYFGGKVRTRQSLSSLVLFITQPQAEWLSVPSIVRRHTERVNTSFYYQPRTWNWAVWVTSQHLTYSTMAAAMCVSIAKHNFKNHDCCRLVGKL